MSRVLPDPQIVQLKAMRAGDIAMALPSPGTSTIGVNAEATALPIVLQSVTISPAAPATGSVSTPAGETAGPVGEAFATVLSQDVSFTISLNGGGSFPHIFFEFVTASLPAGESPVVGVSTGTSVV